MGIYHNRTRRIVYGLEWGTAYVLTRGLFWCLFPELRNNKENKHQNNTQMSTQIVCHKCVTYTIKILTLHNESINNNKTIIFTNRPGYTQAHVTFCWWHHSQSLKTSQMHHVMQRLRRMHAKGDIKPIRYQFYSWPYSNLVVWKCFLPMWGDVSMYFVILCC